MSTTTTKKYQIIQKLENGDMLVLHPETDASVVKVDNADYNAANLSEALTEIYENTETIITDVAGCVKYTDIGKSNGVASLDVNGRVPSSQLPSYVDDVIEGYYYNTKFYKEAGHTTEITGESGKIYVDLETNKTYRWSGSAFVVISETLALGTTASTAYAGDKGAELERMVDAHDQSIDNLDQGMNNFVGGYIAVGKAKALDHNIDIYIDSDTLVGSDELTDFSGLDLHLNVELKPTGVLEAGVLENTYSCVTVDQYGRATAGAQIVEVGTTGQTAPSSTLAIGGIFFKEI